MQKAAFLVKIRGALDPDGSLVAYDFHARSCDYNHVGYKEPDTVLIAQSMGSRRAKPGAGSAAMPSDIYAIRDRRMVGEVVGLPTLWETPLRTGTRLRRYGRSHPKSSLPGRPSSRRAEGRGRVIQNEQQH